MPFSAVGKWGYFPGNRINFYRRNSVRNKVEPLVFPGEIRNPAKQLRLWNGCNYDVEKAVFRDRNDLFQIRNVLFVIRRNVYLKK